MKFVKLIKSRDEGHFIDNKGTWKKVLDKSVETNILGQTVNIDLWHYETDTEDKVLKRQFSSEVQRFTITNAGEFCKNLEKAFVDELKKQFQAKEISRGIGIQVIIPEEGNLVK